MLSNPQLANGSQGVPGYSKWHLGKIPFSQFFNSQIPMKFRKVLWATPDDILAKCLALKSSACSCTASGVLGLRRRWVWEGWGWKTVHHEEKGSPPSLLDHFQCCFPLWSLSSLCISCCLLSSTRTCLWSLARCSGLLQMTSSKNAMLSNRLDPRVKEAMCWDFHRWPWQGSG